MAHDANPSAAGEALVQALAAAAPWDVVRRGSGEPLVVAASNALAQSTELLARLQAQSFELIAIRTPETPSPDELAACIGKLELPPHALLAGAEASSAALRCAACGEQPSPLSRLVLIAPTPIRGPEDAAALAPLLARIAAPTLVTFGSRDPRAAAGRHYRAAMPRCHFVLLYDAGADVARERPAALADLIGDFTRRGERFVTDCESQVLQP